MRIYAIDDEEAGLRLLSDGIKEAMGENFANAEFQAFSLPSAFLQAVEQTPPDVAFMDIELPGTTGLELAKKTVAVKPDVNIIFVTAYSRYAMDALNLFASGYVLKPAGAEDIANAMGHLRYPIRERTPLRVTSFGNFSVFSNGVPVRFRSQKSKELFAYLVDRQGAAVTRKEAAAVLFEDEEYSRYLQKSLCRIAAYLAEDLAAAGAFDVFVSGDGEYSVNLNAFSCDLTDYLKNPNSVVYLGEYMEQYSWGEFRKGNLER